MYAASNATLLHQYQNESVMTASPMDLVIMLYDALIKQIKFADIFIEDKDYPKAHKHLMKAQDIVSELLSSLNLSYSVSDDLMHMYDFMLQELIYINVHKDRSRIPPLLEIVQEFRNAWASVRSSGARAYTIEE